ncbi:hypothetical protein MUN81_08295 [Hymenobacter sp. 5317J-9]|uniref:hypothetical protein n=1 Tax=Hymenobacter sp. 5317J-9 TaxID=2932250 RepID=UPI001FD71994|nr:hypothetical protein [Hymenobacter sp. 5317J-9]UOQ99477.1 hypothetical protein MUN81_08295 [Hymenobacter sp. 5317J-9]
MTWRGALAGLFFLAGTAAQAQQAPATDSITRQLNRRLTQGTVPPMVRVVQVRELLLADLRRDEVRQVPQLLAYVAQTVPDSVTAVQPPEAWALLLAAGQFEQLLKRVAADNPFDAPRLARPRLQPPRDGLFDLTQDYLVRHEADLRARARQVRVPAEDSTFLQLALSLLTQRRFSPTSQGLNADLQQFLDRYPRSEYGYFVARAVRPEYKPSRFSYGLDFHSGTGFFTGGLNADFRPVFNFGHGFEFGWDRYMLYLRNYIGTAETRRPYTADGHTWPAGQRLNYYVPELSVGYRLLEAKRLQVTPFVGASWCNFAPAKMEDRKNPDLDFDVTYGHPLTAGLDLNILLWRTESGPEIGSWLLKIRSGVRAARSPQAPAASGTLFYLDVGIGGFGRLMRAQRPG